jgi:hypothetical protein
MSAISKIAFVENRTEASSTTLPLRIWVKADSKTVVCHDSLPIYIPRNHSPESRMKPNNSKYYLLPKMLLDQDPDALCLHLTEKWSLLVGQKYCLCECGQDLNAGSRLSISDLSKMASDRPRRTIRKPKWTQHAAPFTSTSPSSKRTKQMKNDGDSLDYLLTNPKSKLTTMDLSVSNPSNIPSCDSVTRLFPCRLCLILIHGRRYP